MGCYRYIELNPVRARVVEYPGDSRWSSYRVNAQGEPSTLITPHALYSDLGQSRTQRQAAYRELFRYQLDPGLVDQIRQATNGNYTLGSERFRAEVEKCWAAAFRRAGRGAQRGKNNKFAA